MTDKSASHSDTVKAFWNERAKLGFAAGSQDTVLKKLEMRAIASHVRDGMDVLDVGCGNGVTALMLATEKNANVLGIDNAEAMVEAAKEALKNATLRGKADFRVGDVQHLSESLGTFDVVYTERALINLPDHESHERAIADMTKLLKPGGAYVMCESSEQGLQGLNELRAALQLPLIEKPWHNTYIDDDRMTALRISGISLEKVDAFSGTYYFLSRIVNAALAQKRGEQPSYDDPINALAFDIPPMMPQVAQTKLWIWRKVS